ncbi:hypothetical protein N7456_007127 [Penicillium angulare]|uniref:Ankyrin n=1 Tax=Penicillium angulare TaxID=116970 RepID=A0A9W9FJ16_9EURO|nr:hypothetical protein N7456_007127 [Penicillium angulare]
MVAQMALEDPVHINSINDHGLTPLALAAKYGNIPLTKQLLKCDWIEINAKNVAVLQPWDMTDEYTPLIWAARRGHPEVVRALFKISELELYSRDDDGWTALQHAIDENHEDIVRFMIEVSENMDPEDSIEESTNLDAQREDLVQLLLTQDSLRLSETDDVGFTPLARAAEHQSPRILQILLKQPEICVNATLGTVPPLWAACRAGSLATVQNLMTKKSIQVNQKAPTGTSPLHLAVINQYSRIVSLLLSQEGIAVNDVGPFGSTALMLAAVNGYTACVGRLVHDSSIDLMCNEFYEAATFR